MSTERYTIVFDEEIENYVIIKPIDLIIKCHRRDVDQVVTEYTVQFYWGNVSERAPTLEECIQKFKKALVTRYERLKAESNLRSIFLTNSKPSNNISVPNGGRA